MLLQLLLELRGQKVVDEWVEAAVQACNAERDGVEQSDGLNRYTICYDALGYHQVQQEVDVVGGKTEQEDPCAHPNHAQSLSRAASGLLILVPLSQGIHY